MNRTEAIKAHKLSTGMVDALTGASFREHATGNGEAGYVIHDMHPRTRKALHDRGLMYGHYYLTRTGVEVLATLAGNVVDTRGYEWDGNILRVAAYVETYAQDTVTVQGGEPNTWAPDFDAQGARECYFTSRKCVGPVVAVFVDYVGRTEGVCEGHRDRVEGETYELPTVDVETAENGSESQEETEESMTTEAVKIETVCVVQNTPGMWGESHYHAPGCRDIEREMRRYGQKHDDAYRFAFASVADIINHEDGGRGSDNHIENTPEWWEEITLNASEEIRIMSCLRDSIPAGVTTQGAPIIVKGGYIQGVGEAPEIQEVPREKSEKEISIERAAERFPIGSHVQVKDGEPRKRVGAHSGLVTGHTVSTYRSNNDDARPWYIPAVIIERGDGSKRVILVGDLEFYSDASLIPGAAPAHVETQSTGTTHHSTDAEGKEWVRFEHVLSVGDVVKIIGSQGVYEVHALIPGLPVVYVLGTTGEPFPVGATKLYAL